MALRAAFSVVPVVVQLRVAALVGAGALLCAAPWLLLSSRPALAAVLEASLVLPLVALGWCCWPGLTWGIPRRSLGRLPVPEGQPIRLSFDDGPTPGLSDAVLDLLKASGVRASFFVLTHKARAQPALVRRIVGEGHVLGLHGEDHRTAWLRSAAELEASLSRGRRELEALAGVPVSLYRPSHGWKTPALVRAVGDAGLLLCAWDLGVWDTDAPPAAELLRRLRSAAQYGGGAPVILLHDGRGDDPAVPAHGPALLEALARWLAEL